MNVSDAIFCCKTVSLNAIAMTLVTSPFDISAPEQRKVMHAGFENKILKENSPSFFYSYVAVTAAGQSQRNEEQCDELKAEIKLLKQDLHTSQKEFILACR